MWSPRTWKEGAERTFQSLLDDAVSQGIAPGVAAVVFDRERIVFNGVAGKSEAAPNGDEGEPWRRESVMWMASCTKLCVSVLVLQILERRSSKTGFSLADLDDHEKLVEVLPEFRHGSGSLVTKIIDGFDDAPGADGKRVMKLRDVGGKVTLRQLLTHSSGLAYEWVSPHIAELVRPTDGSEPLFSSSAAGGAIRDFTLPLVEEPGNKVVYGCSTDWLGQFAIRSTGKDLRTLFRTMLFDPLDLPLSEIDIWLNPELAPNRAGIHVRAAPPSGLEGGAGAEGKFLRINFEVYNTEGEPPKGYAHFASACIHATVQAYAKILQAVLRHDERLSLSEETWRAAERDDVTERGIEVPAPLWKTSIADMSYDLNEFATPGTDKPGRRGFNLLQCHVANAPTATGRAASSYGWAGLANQFFFLDPVTGVGGVFGTQLLPFWDPLMVRWKDGFEKAVYDAVGR